MSSCLPSSAAASVASLKWRRGTDKILASRQSVAYSRVVKSGSCQASRPVGFDHRNSHCSPSLSLLCTARLL
ncbi:hypothetical protein RRG08_029592 [Elysia crispata]|uniref:Uncharacterized protein n=1 Tax=Elysia crispata TaxID=231223 RepID=A0AAE1CJX9_9GAST|nr:hypothetical protein RRG08_029592 [Elysia crispata]